LEGGALSERDKKTLETVAKGKPTGIKKSLKGKQVERSGVGVMGGVKETMDSPKKSAPKKGVTQILKIKQNGKKTPAGGMGDLATRPQKHLFPYSQERKKIRRKSGEPEGGFLKKPLLETGREGPD